MDWRGEYDQIIVAANRYGLFPQFIAAIRKTENGGPGKEFGVLSVSAPTFADQLRVCCQTVRHRLITFDVDDTTLEPYVAPNGDTVVVYSVGFMHYLAGIYCPIGADNDPNGLNRNWFNNLTHWYFHLLDAEHQVVSSQTNA